MPPVTPSRTRRPASGLADGAAIGAVGEDLALTDLLEGDRKRLVAQARLDERRDELRAALAELVVVRVDLSGPLGRQDHQRVLGVDLREEVVDLRLDHGCVGPSLEVGNPWMIATSRSTARSRSSFTSTWSNQACCPSSHSAIA